MRRSAVPILALALGVVAVGCSGGEGAGDADSPVTPPASERPSPSPSPTPTDGPAPTEEPSPLPEIELEDGRHFGFIRSVDPEAMTLVLDLAYFLTGEEANEAAAERGYEVPVPNDYFIVNDNPRLRTLVLSPDLRLRLIDWNRCCELSLDGDLEVFATAIERGDAVTVGDSVYHGARSPYWLEIEGGRVVLIEEQYLP